MKNVKTLSSFSNSVIQKGEMKKVMGGWLSCLREDLRTGLLVSYRYGGTRCPDLQ